MAQRRGDSGVPVTGRVRGRLLRRAPSRRCRWAGHVRSSMVLPRDPPIRGAQDPRVGTPSLSPSPAAPSPSTHPQESWGRGASGNRGVGDDNQQVPASVGQMVTPVGPRATTSRHGPVSVPCPGWGGGGGLIWGQRAGSIPSDPGHGASPARPAAAWGRVLDQNTLPQSHQHPTAPGPSVSPPAPRILGVTPCPTATGPC